MSLHHWEIGDFFRIPKNLRHVETFGVFTVHGSVLIRCTEQGDEIVCSKFGITDPIPDSIPLPKDQVPYSHALETFLYIAHAAAVGNLPCNRQEWPVTV